MSVLILVVDDEEDVELLFRQRFRHDLKAGRFVMESAQSASAALQRISNVGSASLILIFSDINMPGMSGLELLPKARAARPDVPVIMITAYGDADTRQKALDGGAEALLTKPIDFGSLRDHIEMRLGLRRERRIWSSTSLKPSVLQTSKHRAERETGLCGTQNDPPTC